MSNEVIDLVVDYDNITEVVEQGPPGEGVPAGGTTGQVLTKSSDSDYATEWTTPASGAGLPEGGITGQLLTKTSNSNFAAGWVSRNALALNASQSTVNTTGFDVLSQTNLQNLIDEVDDALMRSRSTGILYGGQISGLGAATATVAAGAGDILDNSDPENPDYFTLTWSQQSGIALQPGLNYLAINSSGVVTVSQTLPDHPERRTAIQLGRVNVQSGLINTIVNNPMPIQNYSAQIWDLFRAIGIMKRNLQISPSGTNLKIKVAAGEIYEAGSNFHTDATNPHEVILPQKDTGAGGTFFLAKQDGIISNSQTDLPVLNYDNAGTVAAIPGSNNRATIFTLFAFASGNIVVLYGQSFYDSLTQAFNALGNYKPVYPSSFDQGIIIGYIIATKGCTALNNSATATFVQTNRFGGVGGAVATAASVSWGNINGTLADQTDLQTELNEKISSDTTAVSGSLPINNAIALTQAQYDAIVTPDVNTLYIITD